MPVRKINMACQLWSVSKPRTLTSITAQPVRLESPSLAPLTEPLHMPLFLALAPSIAARPLREFERVSHRDLDEVTPTASVVPPRSHTYWRFLDQNPCQSSPSGDGRGAVATVVDSLSRVLSGCLAPRVLLSVCSGQQFKSRV